MENLNELKAREALCLRFIKIIESIDDPRKEEALAEYRSQLERIRARIKQAEIDPANMDPHEVNEQELTKYNQKPEPVVVQLKTAVLSMKEGKRP